MVKQNTSKEPIFMIHGRKGNSTIGQNGGFEQLIEFVRSLLILYYRSVDLSENLFGFVIET